MPLFIDMGAQILNKSEIIDSCMSAKVIDNGGRRSGMDRRAYLYAVHLPERRSGQGRRSKFDRRSGVEKRTLKRSATDRRAYSNTVHIGDVAFG